jgi:ElaB/YqjD/DUF883 family membrane-anchored ribosome-binding protein
MTERQTEEMASTGGADVSQETEQERLVHEIEETRAELGDTVDALAQKTDVKARLSEKLEQRRAAWQHTGSQVARTAEERPWPAIALALTLGLLVGRTLGRR